ncbi:MAG: SMC family ATPase [Armatimonadetes bacterium]|nr:SMC family ATPase [Armatimonadota bacterium]
MVPVRLQVHNFLSYGPDVPPLELERVRMACLSGANGHGKSALLDAVTWALWGEARKAGGTSRPHAGLLRLQADEMWVELWFDHEGARYRVRRSYRRAGRGISLLDLWAWDPDAAAYATFVNSAFLLQGRADEFTRQPPGQRKQILGEILGLSRYDRLCDLARQRRNEADRRLAALDSSTSVLRAELAEEQSTRDARADAERAVAELETAVGEDEAAAETQRRRLDDDRRTRQLLEDLAERRARLERDRDEVEADLADDRRRLAAAEHLLTRRAEVEEQSARLAALTAEREELDRALSRRRALQAERQSLEVEIRGKVREAEAERARAAERLAEAETRRRRDADLLARREAVRQAFRAHQRAREQLEAAEAVEGRHRALGELLAGVEERVERARLELAAEQRSLQSRKREMSARAGRIEALRTEQVTATQQVAEAESAARLVAEADRRLAETEAARERLRLADEQLAVALAELERHAELLAAGEGQCPVCRQALDTERREELTAEYAARRAQLEERRGVGRREALAIRQERAELKERRDGAAECAAALAERQRASVRAEHELAEAMEAGEQAVALAERLAELEARLAQGDYGGEDGRTRQRLIAEREALGYDADHHRALRRAVDAGRDAAVQAERLAEAERAEVEITAAITALRDTLAALDERLSSGAVAAEERAAAERVEAALAELAVDEADLERVDAARRELAEVPALVERLAAAEEQMPALRERLERLTARREERVRGLGEVDRQSGELQAKLLDRASEEDRLSALEEALRTLRRELTEQRERLGALTAAVERHRRMRDDLVRAEAEQKEEAKRRTVLDHLVTAFGRDGIPALIIESAVPEIELAANEVLGRLTAHRMHLGIRLQRPTQVGGERETLDLEISDELGTRSYENYSGGEAFRVNFALRLALSRLLAGRAGARLRTLVIDEGFGTQDEEGIEQLVEALHAVGDEFDLVLVVTHLATLKDRFPTRIEVEKEADLGSRYVMVGEGAAP